MTRPSSSHGSPPVKTASGRHLGSRKARRPSRTSLKAPDLAEAARQAVVGYLHDASAATAQREAADVSGPAGESTGDAVLTAEAILAAEERPMPWSGTSAQLLRMEEAAAVRAAGAAALERIEAAAAKVEADIAAALQRHAELEAGAGKAAEAAVRAAQEAWRAARAASESDKRARISLRLIARYVTITMALLFVAIVVLLVTATTVH
jgi:hypothetical protein